MSMDASRCSLFAKCEVTRCVPAVIGDCGVVQGVRVIEIGEPKLRRGTPTWGNFDRNFDRRTTRMRDFSEEWGCCRRETTDGFGMNIVLID